MIISDINYLETVNAKEVQGGALLSNFLSAYANASGGGSSVGRGYAAHIVSTFASTTADIGFKLASSTSISQGQSDV